MGRKILIGTIGFYALLHLANFFAYLILLDEYKTFET